MDAAPLIARLKATMRAFYRVEAPASPGGRAIELDGVTAFVTPTAPRQSIVNGALFDGVDALRRALPELERTYRVAGVTHWMVWTMPGEDEAAALLRGAGHFAEYEPQGMALRLAELVQPPPATVALTIDPDPDPRAITTLNERANGEPPGDFGAAFAGLHDPAFRRWAALVDGEPAACLVTFDHAGDTIVNWVATDQRFQRRGIARELAHAALADARERGCSTATLQSSYDAERLYAQLGFAPLGRLGMWLWHGDSATAPGNPV